MVVFLDPNIEDTWSLSPSSRKRRHVNFEGPLILLGSRIGQLLMMASEMRNGLSILMILLGEVHQRQERSQNANDPTCKC